MVRSDPYTPGESYRECTSCHNRIDASPPGGACPECGGALRNLAVPRE